MLVAVVVFDVVVVLVLVVRVHIKRSSLWSLAPFACLGPSMVVSLGCEEFFIFLSFESCDG